MILCARLCILFYILLRPRLIQFKLFCIFLFSSNGVCVRHDIDRCGKNKKKTTKDKKCVDCEHMRSRTHENIFKYTLSLSLAFEFVQSRMHTNVI